MDQRIPQDPGDGRADVFAERYEAHYRPLVALCRRLTGPRDAEELGEEYRWARAALAELRPDQRRVIRLRDVEGWSYDRIASHEGVTVESVRGSLRRARSRLRLVYARMSSTSSVIVLLGLLRGARRRLSDLSHRVQSNAATAGVLSGRAADAVAA